MLTLAPLFALLTLEDATWEGLCASKALELFVVCNIVCVIIRFSPLWFIVNFIIYPLQRNIFKGVI